MASSLNRLGQPSYTTRVERWECDYNNHWNVRFYGRSFQAASETVASRTVGQNPGAATTETRHMRFHRELMTSDPVEVHSMVLKNAGEFDGSVVHLMYSGKKLAATALDTGCGHTDLPTVTPKDVPMAMPRGIAGPSPDTLAPKDAQITQIELGPTRSEDLDHMGHLRFDHILRHSSTIQHTQFNQLGLTPEYAETARINRMGVEFRVTRGVSPKPGDCLTGQTWITQIQGKSLTALTSIKTHENAVVAIIEMCVVTVNLDTRKAVPVPEFMYGSIRK